MRVIPSRSIQSAIYWTFAFGITITGLWQFIGLGLIGDDLVLLTQGLSQLWSPGGLSEYLGSILETSVTGNHVVPTAAIFTALYVWMTDAISQGPISLTLAWELLRVFSIVLGIWSASICISVWAKVAGMNVAMHRRFTLIVYCLVAFVTIAFVQVHALWSQDPMISYPVAGWGSVTLAFLYFAACGQVFRKNGKVLLIWFSTSLILGILGIFHYEMMVAVYASTICAIVLKWLFECDRRRKFRFHALVFLTAVVPIVIFLISQWWRSQQLQSYDGTKQGYTALILPVFKNAFLSSLPLSNIGLTEAYADETSVQVGFLLLLLASLVLLLVLARTVYSRTTVSSLQRSSGRDRTLDWGAFLALTTFLLGFWGIATLIFSASAKYQVELGAGIGYVYLFYAVGLISISCLVVQFALLALEKQKSMALWAIVIVCFLVATLQTTVNSRSLVTLDTEFAWTASLMDSLKKRTTNEERCAEWLKISAAELPGWYRTDLTTSIWLAYEAKNGTQYCSHS